MTTAPKSVRTHIGLFGRTNVGKSTFPNFIAGQDVAITSPIAGTTTDVVEKPMELLPIGPVVFLDTAGIDDISALAPERTSRTWDALKRSDIAILVAQADVWTDDEQKIVKAAALAGVPLVVAINKADIAQPTPGFVEIIKRVSPHVVVCSSTDTASRETVVDAFKKAVQKALPDDAANSNVVGDLVKAGGLIVLVVPIDLQAPKGRLILPQVSAIRDALDNDATVVVVKEREYANALTRLSAKPDLVVCDSQVVLKTVADTPGGVPCTTFSILFARAKGDLALLARGAAAIDSLADGDRVLIAEACTHHAAQDDIGRVKIPRWLRQYTGVDLTIDVCSGHDYPDNLAAYSLVIHCGSCMLTRRETMSRLRAAVDSGVSVTNYGVAISVLQGVLEQSLAPFPFALEAYRHARKNRKTNERLCMHPLNPPEGIRVPRMPPMGQPTEGEDVLTKEIV